MKLVSYRVTTLLGKAARIGALVENSVIDLNLAYAGYLSEKGTTGSPYAGITKRQRSRKNTGSWKNISGAPP